MTFSFNWHGPATDFPAHSIEHSSAGVDELRDRVANALKHAAAQVLEELRGHDVTVSGYGSVSQENPHGAVASLHISTPQVTESVSTAASPPSPTASVPQGSHTATAPGTEAGRGSGEPVSGGPGSGGPGPVQSEDDSGGSPSPDVATSDGEPSQG